MPVEAGFDAATGGRILRHAGYCVLFEPYWCRLNPRCDTVSGALLAATHGSATFVGRGKGYSAEDVAAMHQCDEWYSDLRELFESGVTVEAVSRSNTLRHAVGALRALRLANPDRFGNNYHHVTNSLAIDDDARYDLGDDSHPTDNAGPVAPPVLRPRHPRSTGILAFDRRGSGGGAFTRLDPRVPARAGSLDAVLLCFTIVEQPCGSCGKDKHGMSLL